MKKQEQESEDKAQLIVSNTEGDQTDLQRADKMEWGTTYTSKMRRKSIKDPSIAEMCEEGCWALDLSTIPEDLQVAAVVKSPLVDLLLEEDAPQEVNSYGMFSKVGLKTYLAHYRAYGAKIGQVAKGEIKWES